MLSSLKARAKLLTVGFAFLFSMLCLTGPAPISAQEQYPSVARLSFVSGAVTYSRGDDPEEWDEAIENVPITIGDRIYAPEDGRAEIQLSSGNFVRLAGYLSTLNLADDVKQFYLGAGTAAFTIRRLQTDEVIEIDTPNVAVTLDEPGDYRVAVDENGDSRITVRRGRATVAANGRQVTLENSEIRVYGIDSPRYEIVALPAGDAFDRWVMERDDRFARASANAYRYASEDIVGAEDLSEYGRWENIPEYGYAWTPSVIAAGWTPFSDGHWYWQDPWGWTWISKQRWGWATSHYGRWTPYRSRWYWVPVRPRNRVKYAPACVEFVRIRDHVGWFPLHPRDRQIPWWERRDRRRFDRNVTYMNRTYVTIVDQTTFASARPVHRHIVRDSVVLREFTSSRLIAESLPIPNRSSLRVVAENRGRRDGRPSAAVVNRVAVVRTAPPAPPRTFQEKLPEIQKNQGKPVEPTRLISTAQDDRARAQRVRIRAAADADRGNFAPRNPGATSVPPPQPLTEAHGKRLATRDNPVRLAEERTPVTPTPLQPAQPSQLSPTQGNAGKASASRADRDRERQQLERDRRAQHQELERRKQEQQKEAERKVQAQKQQEERKARQSEDQRRQGAKSEPAASSPEQQRLEELERRQAQQEKERKTQALQRQEQERRQQLRQQQLHERQAQQQKQQELQRRQQQQQQQQEQERRLQMQQQQQEQSRREQLRQQQLQESQVREQQRRQLEGRQQLQEREFRQLQRQQEQERRQQLRQQQPQERQLQQPPRQPGQF